MAVSDPPLEETKTKIFKTRIKQRRDTSANWESKNPVLLNGEVIIVDTANGETRTKTGDGTKTYTQLPFDDEGTKGGKSLVDTSKILTKDNTEEYTPSADYNPATKKYVDERIDLSTLDNKVDKVVGKSLIDENVADNLSGDTTTVRIKKGTELKTNGSEINGVRIDGNSVTVGAVKNDMSDPYIGYKNVMDKDGLHIYGVDMDGNQDTNERVDITSSGVKYSGAQGNGRTLKLGFEETGFPQLIIDGNLGESKSVKIDFNDVIVQNESTTHKLSEKVDSIELERIKYYGDKDIIPSLESYFTVNATGETITGLTDTGKTQTELVIPYEINGKKITKLSSGHESSSEQPVSILYGNSTVTKVMIPKSVTTLGRGAFFSCKSLKSINIPNSVTSIEDYAFCNSSLTSIDIPNSVTSIEQNAFSSCSSLTSIDIPNSVTSIGDSAFSSCSALTSANIPNTVTSIGTSAFLGRNPATLTIYCEQGSYAETHAKNNNNSVVYTDIKDDVIHNKAEAKTYTVSIPTTSWMEKTDTDNQKYYFKRITVSGMTASGQAMTDIAMADSVSTARKEMEAYQCVNRVVTGNDYIDLYCFEEVPTTAFTLRILVISNILS